jgi:predicted CXXCH cytochrome family protein
MSSHGVQGLGGATFVRWGYVNGTASDLTAMTSFTCTDCHDPHGSSNYRLLKDVVNGVTVGGYVGTNNTPAPYVISNEEGYPSGGWAKGDNGAAQMAVYKPSYTSAQYAKTAPGKSMSAWCAACHTVYAESDSTYDYDGTISGPKGNAQTMYHRHPIDVPLSVGTSPNAEDRSLITQLLDNAALPLEMGSGLLAPGATHADTKIWDDRGNVTCLTCHRAHGTEATMEGWAASPLGTDGLPVLATGPAIRNGVDPTFDAALLRMDNRGVCEACHNK